MSGEDTPLETRTIAFVGNTSWFLHKFCGGPIKALRERGASVVCIAPVDDSSAKLTEELGAEHIHLDLDFDGFSPLRELRSFAQLLRIVSKHRPDFVFNFTIKPNIYSGIACRLLRLPYANNITGLGMAVGSSGPRARLVESLYKFANGGAARVFVQNPDDLAFMRKRGWLHHVPVAEIPGLGVDVEHFAAQVPPALPLTFVMISRLQADKGVREFVDAARLVRGRHPDARFILVGSNEHVNRSGVADAEIAAWRVEGVLETPGAAEDVRPWLAESHALVLPSYKEGMPTVVMEAAASARPALVSDVPGCRQAVVDSSTGYLFPPRDTSALVEAIEKFMALPPEKRSAMGQAARALAEERFSEKIVIDAYLDCLASFTASSSTAR